MGRLHYSSNASSSVQFLSRTLVPAGNAQGITAALPISTTFTPDFLARAAEQLGWDESPDGQAKRLEALALLQELMAVTRAAVSSAIQVIARGTGAEQD